MTIATMTAASTHDDIEMRLTGGAKEIVGWPSHAFCRAAIDSGRNRTGRIGKASNLPRTRRGRPVTQSEAYKAQDVVAVQGTNIQEAELTGVALVVTHPTTPSACDEVQVTVIQFCRGVGDLVFGHLIVHQ